MNILLLKPFLNSISKATYKIILSTLIYTGALATTNLSQLFLLGCLTPLYNLNNLP